MYVCICMYISKLNVAFLIILKNQLGKFTSEFTFPLDLLKAQTSFLLILGFKINTFVICIHLV